MGTSDGAASAKADDADGDHLDEDEIRRAISDLTALDILRLEKVDALFRQGTDFEPGALLHGAYCQALMGERKCRRDMPFARFLAGAMRSVGWHRRCEMARQVPFDVPHGITADGEPGLALQDRLPSGDPNPEECLVALQTPRLAEALMALFDGDDEAQLVILGLDEGLKGARLCAQVGVTSDRLHYVIRLIRRKAKRRYPNGWMP